LTQSQNRFETLQVKGFASGIVACMASAMIFVVVKVFPDLVLNIGAHGAYYLFAIICLITTVFSCFFVPETRGKSDAELQQLFHKDKKNQDNQLTFLKLSLMFRH
jgi:facilitated trehalose transporter